MLILHAFRVQVNALNSKPWGLPENGWQVERHCKVCRKMRHASKFYEIKASLASGDDDDNEDNDEDDGDGDPRRSSSRSSRRRRRRRCRSSSSSSSSLLDEEL